MNGALKRFLLMLNTASKWFIQEILLLALATVFALSSMQLFMMLEYLRLEYATVNASLSGDTYWLFPSMRIENICLLYTSILSRSFMLRC